MTRKSQLIAAGAIVALLAAYFMYSSYRDRTQTALVAALVTDTAARLGKALEIDAEPTAPDAAALQAQIDEHFATAGRSLAQLRALDASGIRPLADTADEYLNTSVEILRRKAASHSQRIQLALSLQALREHMKGDTRGAAWVSEAIRAKERMDRDFRDYRLAAEALARLLDGYAISRRRMAEHVDPALLPDDRAAEAARSRTLAAIKATAEDVANAGRLHAHR